MKRAGRLWDELISFENLLRAAQTACKGKRFRPPVAAFHSNLEGQLWQLHRELAAKTYRPGPYRTFYLYQPKKRQISAAPYRDRVVHHALTQMLEPSYEKSFLPDSYACRQGKGTHAAVDRSQHYARRFRYVLKADVEKFFPSVDHEILKRLLARKIKDPDVLWLAGLILDNGNPQEEVQHWFAGDDLFAPGARRRGLPIGNQTSQFFANVYLDPLDHFVKDHLRAGGFVRYCDDFLVFSNDKNHLASQQPADKAKKHEVGQPRLSRPDGMMTFVRPELSITFAVARAPPSSRTATTTAAPWMASMMALAWPIPDVPPVTWATSATSPLKRE